VERVSTDHQERMHTKFIKDIIVFLYS